MFVVQVSICELQSQFIINERSNLTMFLYDFFGECRGPGGDNKKISERQWMLISTVDIVIYGIGVSVQSAPTLSKASTFEISYFTQECFIRLLYLFILISVSSVLLLSVSLCIVFL